MHPSPSTRDVGGTSKGVLGSLFGGNEEEKAAKRALDAQRERVMSVITLVDPACCVR